LNIAVPGNYAFLIAYIASSPV